MQIHSIYKYYNDSLKFPPIYSYWAPRVALFFVCCHKAYSIQDVYLGPLIFTIVSLKRRPIITSNVLYDVGSCRNGISLLGIAFSSGAFAFRLIIKILISIILIHTIELIKSVWDACYSDKITS